MSNKKIERRKKWEVIVNEFNKLFLNFLTQLLRSFASTLFFLLKSACVNPLLLNENFATGGNVQYGEIAGGKYAVFTVKHTAEAVEQAWAEIFPTLSDMGCLPDSSRPILERYAAEKVEQHFCEICVPIY